MKHFSLMLLLIATSAFVATAGADLEPRPESLKLVAYYDKGDTRFREIQVNCSNRTESLIYKQERVRQWCVGGPGAGECFRDNISAAKTACASDADRSLANN